MSSIGRKNSGVIRARYYEKLGICPPSCQPFLQQQSFKDDVSNATSSTRSLSSVSSTSSISSTASRTLDRRCSVEVHQCQHPIPLAITEQPTKLPSCLRHKRSVLHATPAKHERVSFHPDVRLYRIKSHEDYTDEEWHSVWTDSDTLAYEKDRNTFEVTVEGTDWRNALEEDRFYEGPDGSLVHPATWYAYRHHWERYGDSDWATTRIDFAALTAQHRRLISTAPQRRRYNTTATTTTSGWSPTPGHNQRKTFWLLDLAIQSVQKGREETCKKKNHHRNHATIMQEQPTTMYYALPFVSL